MSKRSLKKIVKQRKRRRKNPAFPTNKTRTPDVTENLAILSRHILTMMIQVQIQDMTMEEKTFLLAILPQLKKVIRAIPREKLVEMTPDTHITIH